MCYLFLFQAKQKDGSQFPSMFEKGKKYSPIARKDALSQFPSYSFVLLNPKYFHHPVKESFLEVRKSLQQIFFSYFYDG